MKCHQGESKLILLNAARTQCNLVSQTSPQGNKPVKHVFNSGCWVSHQDLVLLSLQPNTKQLTDYFPSHKPPVQWKKTMQIFKDEKSLNLFFALFPSLLLTLCIGQTNSFAATIISAD